MSRLQGAFDAARADGRAALVAYVCAGDPDLPTTARIVTQLARSGADVVELGVPFSDPIADGPTIQAASFRALQAGTTLRGVLQVVAELRGAGCTVPLVLMTYLNPVLAYGFEAFFGDAARAGVDGLIVPDGPLEESDELSRRAQDAGVDLVLLAAPTTPPARLAEIGRRTRGFLYCVSVAGVTGARTELPASVVAQLAAARAVCAAPVAVGFGVARPEQVAALAAHADGVVVGSALVQRLHEAGGDPEAIAGLVRALRDATRRR
jgi:tryptophan synthase alpha chain